MLVHVEVQGEPDTKPLLKCFEYSQKSDEDVFFESVNSIHQKIIKNLRLNIDEVIVYLVAFVVLELKSGKQTVDIIKNASQLLSPDKVMIGVPESLQKLILTINFDNISQTITLTTPIEINEYLLVDKSTTIKSVRQT